MCSCINYILQYFCNNTSEHKTQECVICLEKENKSNTLQHIDKYMYNKACECNYYIHENCFYTWSSSHYYNRNNNKMNCLICNSLGNIFVDKYNNNNDNRIF